MSQSRVTVCGGLAAASLAVLIAAVWLDVARRLQVHIDVVIALAGFWAVASVGYIAGTCTRRIITRIDEHDTKMSGMVTTQTEVLRVMAGFADAVVEYGDVRGAEAKVEAQLELLRELAADPPNSLAPLTLRVVPDG